MPKYGCVVKGDSMEFSIQMELSKVLDMFGEDVDGNGIEAVRTNADSDLIAVVDKVRTKNWKLSKRPGQLKKLLHFENYFLKL